VKQWLSKTMFSSVKDKPALACSCCKQLENTNKYHRLFQLTAPWKDLTTNTERKAQSHFMPNSKTATATAMHALKNSALKKHIKTVMLLTILLLQEFCSQEICQVQKCLQEILLLRILSIALDCFDPHSIMSSKLQGSHSPGRKSWIEQECMQQINNNPSHQERSDKLMMLMMMCIWLASSGEEEEA
jgi:hypothetical protein